MLCSCQTSVSSEALACCIILSLWSFALLCHHYTGTSNVHQDVQYLHLPYSTLPPPSSIPKIIWYKLGPLGLNNETQDWTDTCIRNNPNYSVQFLEDEDAEDFVSTAFSNRPDIIEAYFGLTVPILKADMLRYMLLYDQGEDSS
jgi:alpha 1,6-mannosyltransferase